MAIVKKQEAAETVRQVMPEPEGGWPADEFTGKGGTYIRDPYTGLRRPADAPAPATDQPDAA